MTKTCDKKTIREPEQGCPKEDQSFLPDCRRQRQFC